MDELETKGIFKDELLGPKFSIDDLTNLYSRIPGPVSLYRRADCPGSLHGRAEGVCRPAVANLFRQTGGSGFS